MKKPISPDSPIAYVVGIIAVAIVSGAAMWYFMGQHNNNAPVSNNTRVGPLDFKIDDQSARISLDLQSSGDARWPKQHQGALERVIDETLAKTDPAVMTAPNDVKFATIQTAVLQNINKNFPEAKIEKVFVTDYVSAQN